MNIEYRNGDLLKQEDVNIIIHQCNCYCTMGGGIARQIANTYPQVKERDSLTKTGDIAKLGRYTYVEIENGQTIINMYSQYEYGVDTRNTNYGALGKALMNIFQDMKLITNDKKDIVIGIPYLLGCGLAGGDWKIVEEIIMDVCSLYPEYKLVICEL